MKLRITETHLPITAIVGKVLILKAMMMSVEGLCVPSMRCTRSVHFVFYTFIILLLLWVHCIVWCIHRMQSAHCYHCSCMVACLFGHTDKLFLNGQIKVLLSLQMALVWVRWGPVCPKIGVLCIFEFCCLQSQKQWRYLSDMHWWLMACLLCQFSKSSNM